MTSISDFGGTVPPTSPSSPAPATVPHVERLVFSGRDSEYFRIWIVNLLLTMVTFGIYSAWAKVRKAQYMYGATSLAGSSFEYHGNPVAIFKGRIIALVLLVSYQVAFHVSTAFGFFALAVFMIVMPWLVWKSLQFKLHNSSYRGIRFSFRGDLNHAYRVYLFWSLLNGFTLFMLTPFIHQRVKRYQHGDSYFGQTRFGFHATPGAFYRQYGLAVLIAFSGVLVISALAFRGIFYGSSILDQVKSGSFGIVLGFIAVYVWIFALFPLFFTMIQNLIWSNTSLGQSRFKSDMKWTTMTFIAVTNLLGIMVTGGLFTPFAQLRTIRYRIESLSMTMDENIEQFLAAPAGELAATGEGASDMFGFDISL